MAPAQPAKNAAFIKCRPLQEFARTLKLSNRFPRQKAEKKTAAAKRLMTVK